MTEAQCRGPECSRPVDSKGLCKSHWYQNKHAGRLWPVGPEGRFWRRVQKSDGCWTWTGYTRAGYGRYFWQGRKEQAHRVAYEIARGPIPEGLQLDHLCRNRSCVRPDHLEPVTQQENIIRGYAARGPRTHCRMGHELTAENTVVDRAGARICHTCRREVDRLRAQARRARLRQERMANV